MAEHLPLLRSQFPRPRPYDAKSTRKSVRVPRSRHGASLARLASTTAPQSATVRSCRFRQVASGLFHPTAGTALRSTAEHSGTRIARWQASRSSWSSARSPCPRRVIGNCLPRLRSTKKTISTATTPPGAQIPPQRLLRRLSVRSLLRAIPRSHRRRFAEQSHAWSPRD